MSYSLSMKLLMNRDSSVSRLEVLPTDLLRKLTRLSQINATWGRVCGSGDPCLSRGPSLTDRVNLDKLCKLCAPWFCHLCNGRSVLTSWANEWDAMCSHL